MDVAINAANVIAISLFFIFVSSLD
jgi:hypothetical protein